MVRGLDIFREWFAAYADQYVLIGDTAATLTMEDAGLAFRATKDLDIVLHVEALTPAFGEAFWKFVDAGKYEIRQAARPTSRTSTASSSPATSASRRWSNSSPARPMDCSRPKAAT